MRYNVPPGGPVQLVNRGLPLDQVEDLLPQSAAYRIAFEQEGLVGLIPQKRGPRQAHKLNTEVLDFVVQAQATQPGPRFGELARMIEERFGFHVHPRSIERALWRRKKNV